MKEAINNKKQLTPDSEILTKVVIIPSNKLSVILTATEAIKRLEVTENLIEKNKKNPDKDLEAKLFAIGNGLLGSTQIPPSNMLEDFSENAERDIDNEVFHGEELITISERDVKSKKKGKVSGKVASMKAYSFLGLGGIVQIPLWHSGFWITLGNISSTDMVNLNYKLADNTVVLGRDTNGLIYSNDAVIFNRIIIEFILKHMIDTSVDFSDESIMGYIKTPDISILTLGLISAMKPDGFDVLLSCKNSLEVNEKEKNVECGYVISAKLDPKKILMVDKKSLSLENKAHMAKRTSNAQTLEEVLVYQESLDRLQDKDYEIEHNGQILKLRLQTPSMLEYINAGEMWIENIKEVVSETLSEDDSPVIRQSRYEEMYRQTILNTYSHYIKRLYVTEDEFVEDDSSYLIEVLNTYALDSDLSLKIMKTIRKHINHSVIAIVGTNVYICPRCKKDNEDPNSLKEFKEVVPLDILKVFFDLSTLR